MSRSTYSAGGIIPGFPKDNGLPYPPDNTVGGARRVASASAKWTLSKRKATLKDGSVKSLWQNSVTRELRVKKMVTRGGHKVASYVKP